MHNSRGMTYWNYHTWETIKGCSVRGTVLNIKQSNKYTCNSNCWHVYHNAQAKWNSHCSGLTAAYLISTTMSVPCLYHHKIFLYSKGLCSNTEHLLKPLSKEWKKRQEKQIVYTIWSSLTEDSPENWCKAVSMWLQSVAMQWQKVFYRNILETIKKLQLLTWKRFWLGKP